MKLTRRTALASALAAWASKAFARLHVGGGAPPPPPSITNVLIAGSATNVTYPSSTANAPIGLITAATSDGSNPSITVVDTDMVGFHPLSGTANSMTLMAPTGGEPPDSGHHVTITASGVYLNSPLSIMPLLTAAPVAMLVNSSLTPAAVVAGDGLHVALTSIPPSTNIRVTLEDSNPTPGVWNSVPSSGYIAYTSSTVDIDMKLSEFDPVRGQNVPLGRASAVVPGTYFVRLYYSSAPSTVQKQVSFTVNTFVPYPFPYLNSQTEPNGIGLLTLSVAIAAGGTVRGGATSNSGVLSVAGNIAVATGYTSGASGFSPIPTNVTIQFYAVDSALTQHPIGNSPSTAPIFSSAGTPGITSFDTTTLTDGSYIIWAKVRDIADTSSGHWSASVFMVVPEPLIIQNGSSAMNPAGTFMIPTSYTGQNRRMGSTTPDAIPYVGVPIANNAAPYPSDAVAGNYLLPVYNTSSTFHGTPSNGRAPPLGFWWQGVQGIRTNEYRNVMRFSQTTAGGIFTQGWYGKLTGTESIEGGYPAVAAGSYRDSGRNSSLMSNFVTCIATPSTGPWAAYHWTLIQEDGRLAVMDLTGQTLTIAAYHLDSTKLQHDWDDFTGNPEYPDSLQVGTIDTNPMFTFSDFGGAPADCCWDPRDPFICYVSQTIDHDIIKINFHTQTLGGVSYGLSNPLCQRYAGYKSGLWGVNNLNATSAGGYADGPALDTVVSGIQCTAILTGAAISGTTLTFSSSTGAAVAVGQYVSDTNAGGGGAIAIGTKILSGGGTSWTVNNSQTVSTRTLYTNSGAQFNGVYSITMQHRTDNTSYPQGTMFVCDNYNGLIRVISAAAISPTTGNFTGAGPTVTTLAGTHSGTVPVSTAIHDPFNWNLNVLLGSVTVSVSSMTDNLDGTASVVLNSSPANPVTSVGWKMYVLVGGVVYQTGGSTYENSLGKYTVSAFTNSTHFSLTIHPVPTGTITVFIPVADTYSSPQPVSFASGSDNAYTAYPNTIRMTSLGDIVYGESWYNMMCRRIWLNNNPNSPSGNYNTITRLMPFGNNAFSITPSGGNTNAPAFGWFAIDNPMIDTAVGTVTIGACGPIDDVVVFKTDSDPGSAANAFRFSLDLSYNSVGNWFGDGGPDFPSEGSGGVGHYPWLFVFSNTAFRMLSGGLQPSGWFQWRPIYPGDPDKSFDLIGGKGDTFVYPYFWADVGWILCQQGSRAILPSSFRPGISALLGANGLHQYGANTGPTLDDLPAMFSTNATLGAYIQGVGSGQIGALFGSVKRPEFSFDDDGVTPSRPLAALMYYIRRQALSGSWPTQQAPLFNLSTQSPRDNSGQLAAAGQWSLNYIRPNITVTSPGGVPQRVTSTQIRVQWTTDKNTLGIIIAGTPNSITSNSLLGFATGRYNFWTTLEMDNGAVWGMTHDVTITGLPDVTVTPPAGTNTPTHVQVLVIDRAGNWAVTADFSVS